MIKITAVGGYGEIGRNMTLVTVDSESIVLDMGVHLDRMLSFNQDEDPGSLSASELIFNGIIPDDRTVKKNTVKAIIPSHGHLDHIAAIPYLEKNYDCPIVCTPYTAQVIRRQFQDNKFRQKNKIKQIQLNKKIAIGNEFEVEFIAMTHSIPHTALIVIHTKYGNIVYANDFKLDLHPTLMKKPDMDKIRALSKNTKVLISECLRAKHAGRTPSEHVAVEMLRDILFGTDTSRNCIFITTFSSHIERLETVVDLAKKIGRKVIFLGRSLEKYTSCAKIAQVSNIIDKVEIVSFRNQVKRRLRQFQGQDKSKFIVVMTGHQGEKQAVLYNMLTGKLPSVFSKKDLFIFSCNVIPTPAVQLARAEVEEKLINYGVRLFKDVHVSGHASREDLRDLLHAIKPQHVIPAHGTIDMMEAYAQMAMEEGYEMGSNIHFLDVGRSVDLR